jgi:PhzF family phenazine biosynthesis protein
MRIQEMKCFGEHSGDGNPALVIEDDHSDAAERQALARSRDTTCVFIDPCSDVSATRILDYFYPHQRSPLCLHATLAAAQLLLAGQGSDGPIAVKTALRGQRLLLSRLGAELFVRLAQHEVPAVAIAPDLPARLLAAPDLELASLPVVASIGSPKLLIEVPDAATLHRLRPDLGLIAQWGKANGINGCYVWCRTGEDMYEGRNFNHLDPALEDSATGVAAGALTAVLGRGITLRQGRATGRSCLIRTALEGDAVLVGGRVEAAGLEADS